MRTWNDYKEQIKAKDPEARKNIEEIEAIASIVSAMIEKRNELGISRRELAPMCGMPQSSAARIESFQTTPNLDTAVKIMQPLGLRLIVSATN